MELIGIHEIPPQMAEEHTFREGIIFRLMVASGFFFIALGVPCAVYISGAVQGFGSYFLMATWVPFFLFFSWSHFSAARAALQPSNWLLKIRPDRVFVNLRSYLNGDRPEEDRVILSLTYNEIGWTRKHMRTTRVPKGGTYGQAVATWTFLDLKLPEKRLPEVETALLAEELGLPQAIVAKARAADCHTAHSVSTWYHKQVKEGFLPDALHGGSQHMVATMAEPGVLSLQWRGEHSRVVSSLEKALALLQKHVPLERERRRGLPPQEQTFRVAWIVGAVFAVSFAIALYTHFGS